jgi:hypothetical protein
LGCVKGPESAATGDLAPDFGDVHQAERSVVMASNLREMATPMIDAGKR